jgi:hypothetical protein
MLFITAGPIIKREETGKTGRHPVLKYRVPHVSNPATPGLTPDRGWACTSHPGGLGSIPKRETNASACRTS